MKKSDYFSFLILLAIATTSCLVFGFCFGTGIICGAFGIIIIFISLGKTIAAKATAIQDETYNRRLNTFIETLKSKTDEPS